MKFISVFRKKKSRDIAKDRLKILLISDRINCTPEVMERIKQDIFEVLTKYIQIDSEKMEIQVSKRKINVFW
ncbi:MAG: cell division topological specificity factor MinE [Lachnospiraceae bacterium]|jgi:cell division topological specificity factor|nr:cell division topological specificity factor MinE [Lachnospiraceae bacterium]